MSALKASLDERNRAGVPGEVDRTARRAREEDPELQGALRSGQVTEVEVRGTPHAAVVTALPFYKRPT